MSCKISASGSPLKVVVWSTAESLGWQYGAASAARPIAPLSVVLAPVESCPRFLARRFPRDLRRHAMNCKNGLTCADAVERFLERISSLYF